MGARFSPFAGSCLAALAIGALACGIFAIALSKARAQQSPVSRLLVFCGESKAMAARLKQDLGEEPVSRGQLDATSALVVFANPDGESWTILRVTTRGKACVVAAGHGWDQAVETAGGL